MSSTAESTSTAGVGQRIAVPGQDTMDGGGVRSGPVRTTAWAASSASAELGGRGEPVLGCAGEGPQRERLDRRRIPTVEWAAAAGATR